MPDTESAIPSPERLLKINPEQITGTDGALIGFEEEATALNKSERQVRRYCKLGLVPGAFRTPGGHWRVPKDENTVAMTKANILEMERCPKDIVKNKWLALSELDEPPLPEELPFGDERLHKMSPLQQETFLIMRTLASQNEEITAGTIADELGMTVPTFYEKVFSYKEFYAIVDRYQCLNNAHYDLYGEELLEMKRRRQGEQRLESFRSIRKRALKIARCKGAIPHQHSIDDEDVPENIDEDMPDKKRTATDVVGDVLFYTKYLKRVGVRLMLQAPKSE